MIFREVARKESCAIQISRSIPGPPPHILFREFYCTDPGCDCRRVVLHAIWVEQKRVVASIGYGFEPSAPPFEDEPQIMLDPLNPQSEVSDQVLQLFEELLKRDGSIRERFIRHYEMWKAVVDDPSHADHHRVRSKHHDDPTFTPAYKPTSENRFAPNQRCYCQSGKKFKNCCGRLAGQATRP